MDVLGGDLTAFVRYLQGNERHRLVMGLVARAVESFSLRPITGSLEWQVPVDAAERRGPWPGRQQRGQGEVQRESGQEHPVHEARQAVGLLDDRFGLGV
ncbi:hypothetical protein, partial [Nonomuraea sp. NPDC023979]|uniref:hypothetical protein n=1 Tax=Nonomuraea sp. NPDC023979 TaxID=3154796 RepID=UPI0033E3DD13